MKKKPFIKVCGKDIKVEGRLIRIARPDADTYESLKAPEGMLEGLRKSGIRIDLFTFMQIMPQTVPTFVYPMEWDNLAILEVSTFDHWWTKQIDSKTRNMIRKAEKKGTETREIPFDDALVRGIWGIYNECPVRQGKPFSHYGKDLEAVREHAATFLDSSIFVGTFLGEQLIGFVKLTTDEARTQANVMHIISMMQHRDKAPTNALIARAVRSCCERGISRLAYSNFSCGKKQEDSLSDFKKNNGFKKVDVPRYYVPLTRLGRAAFRLGLHHRFVDHFPEPLMARLRKLRTAWYTRKLQPSGDAS
jgi:hypothetical protein